MKVQADEARPAGDVENSQTTSNVPIATAVEYNNDKPYNDGLVARAWEYLEPYLVREPGVKIGDEKGFYGKDTPHILTYNPGTMRSLLFPFTSSDITVCNSVSQWITHMGMLIYAVLLMVILSRLYKDGTYGAYGPACK